MLNMSTFEELGIPFPLYEAPTTDCADFAGQGTCCICGSAGPHSFRVGVGAALIVSCPSCKTDNGLHVADKAAKECRACGGQIQFPATIAQKKEPKVCYACLRSGKVALTKDTEFGMVSWEQ